MNGKARKAVPYLSAMLSMAAAMFVIAAFTGQWVTKHNPYNSYTLQALSWLEGRLDLGQDYVWLELAIYGGKYYVSFPPFPSYMLLPFAALMGSETPDAWISLCFTMVGVCCAVALGKRHGIKPWRAVFWSTFLYLGTGYLFISMNGYVWFIAQTMNFTLALLMLYFADCGLGLASLACWACAVGCRPMMGLYLPLPLWLLLQSEKEKFPGEAAWRLVLRRWYWILPPLVIGGSYMVLNYARFGNALEFGHNYLPEFTRTQEGQFNFAYLKENLKNLLRWPVAEENGGPLKFYNINGMAFYLINPMLIAIAAAWLHGCMRMRKGNGFMLISGVLMSVLYVLILCCHRTLGGWQFGNRYLLDILPALFLLLLRLLPEKEWLEWLSLPLLILGFALNVVGTVCTYNYWI